MADELVGGKNGGSCIAATNLGVPCSPGASPPQLARRVSSTSAAGKVHPELDRSKLVPQLSTKVTCNTEVPKNNNGSGQQPVPHVPTSNTEVPKNNDNSNCSRQQVNHVALNVRTSMDNSRNSGPQDGSNYGNWKLSSFLAVVECMTGIIAHFIKPPSSGKPIYHVAEAIVLVAGMLEVLGTIWVSCDAHNRRAAEKRILTASLIMFMLGLILGASSLM